MRFLLLTPGTGHFYCGSCLRDNTLGAALRRLGHDVTVAPLYLPHVLEDDDKASREETVHMGGINMYLQQKSKLAQFMPGFLERWLDRPGLLRWASRRGSMTEAPDLGAMTVSMLRGEDGLQKKEVAKLVSWVRELERPDVIVLSNAMLTGIVRALKNALDCRIVVTLQGEQPFLDSLDEPFREQAWQALRERASEVDAFVPVSASYGAVMQERLQQDPARFHVIHNGLDLRDFEETPQPLAKRERRIGYLARMCRDKGLHTLVDAFVQLKTGEHKARFADVKLDVIGVVLNEDKAFVQSLKDRLESHGLAGHYEFSPNVDRKEKLARLRSWRAFSVPATYGESFGLYLLEASVSGVPVVQPRHGSFPEILEHTEAGLLCEPDDAASLAEKLAELLGDDANAQRLADNGRRAVHEKFSDEHMAHAFVAHCQQVLT